MSNSTDGRSVTSKLAAILRTFSTGNVHSLSDIARSANLPVSTAHRLTAELAECGLLERTNDKRYRVGTLVTHLGTRVWHEPNLQEHARRILDDLSSATHATVRLGVLEDLAVSYIEKRPDTHSASTSFETRSLPAHATAMGKALLAFAPPETVDATWLLLQSTPRAGQVGTTLPGRWRRSVDDASLAERLGVRVRVVKGQWADGAPGVADPGAGVLAVVDRLRGHRGGVAVATHDVALLAESLRRLIAAETPCAAELFFGMPFRAPAMAAERLGVPIRIYVPYGHAGAPYGIADVTHRPVAAWWLMQDLVLGKDKTWLGIRRSRPQR